MEIFKSYLFEAGVSAVVVHIDTFPLSCRSSSPTLCHRSIGSLVQTTKHTEIDGDVQRDQSISSLDYRKLLLYLRSEKQQQSVHGKRSIFKRNGIAHVCTRIMSCRKSGAHPFP